MEQHNTQTGSANRLVAAYQGEPGAYAEAALVAHFGDRALPVSRTTFHEVFEAVAAGDADTGVVPIENSLNGSVFENYDLLLEHNLHIVGEVTVPVHHALLAPPGTSLDDVTHVYSHPQALAQCMRYLRDHSLEPRNAYNTAGAAQDVATNRDPGAAAIASARAAKLYGLDVLATDIQSRSDNTTRFFVIARERADDAQPTKVSVVYTTHNAPGALFASLESFAAMQLNLTKIESRPTRDTQWEYYFYVDFERADGSPFDDDSLRHLLARLESKLAFLRLLGAYRPDPPTA